MQSYDLKLLRHLATFALVVNEGSFAGAARKLALSRSRISDTISVLETHLDTRLIHRTTRQLSLTNEGKSVYEYAKNLPNLVDDISAEISQQNLSGKITLTCTHDVAVKILATRLAEFESRYPDIQIELMLSDLPLDLISEEVDMAIRVGVPKDSSYIGRTLHSERLALYASPEYLQRTTQIRNIEQLYDHSWVCLKQLLNAGTFELNHGDQTHLMHLERYHVCDSPIMMQKMLCEGMGIGLLLPSTIKEELAQSKLVPVLPKWQGTSLDYALYYPSRRHLPLRTRYLIDFIVEANLFT